MLRPEERRRFVDLARRAWFERGDAMLLRCVIHRGHARRDRWGWGGDDVNLVFRLLDSRTWKLRRKRDEEIEQTAWIPPSAGCSRSATRAARVG
jgi:hypothetical protein